VSAYDGPTMETVPGPWSNNSDSSKPGVAHVSCNAAGFRRLDCVRLSRCVNLDTPVSSTVNLYVSLRILRMEKPLGVFSLPLHYPPDIDHSRLAYSSMTTVEVKPAEHPSASSNRDQTESSCAISATSASFAASLISGIPAHFPSYMSCH
jgi:hypothetical protein